MKRCIDVHAGEVMAGQGEVVLRSDSNRECLVIAAYDPAKKIGGLAHAMFTAHAPVALDASHKRSAEQAIDEMISDMSLLGADTHDIEVRLVTGENIARNADDPEYGENINSAINALRQKHIRFRRDTVADAGNGHVVFDVDSGNISYA